MTTWTRNAARRVARKLHDVNFKLSLARVNLLNGHEQRAADFVAEAMDAKDGATKDMPPIMLDDDQIDFGELYPFFWAKDFNLYQASNVAASAQDPRVMPNPLSRTWAYIKRQLRYAALGLRQLADREWPDGDPCKAKLEKIIRSLNSAADFMDDNPPQKVDRQRLRDGAERLWREQVEFLRCAYPDSPVPMEKMLGQFNAMNLWLINVYSALRTGAPPWGVDGERRRDLLRYIETAEGFKAVALDLLDEAYPGSNAPLEDWAPLPDDPLPLPPGHASRAIRKGRKRRRAG